MTRFTALAASVIVVVALAVPSAVGAQATRRGGSSSGGSSEGSSRGGSGGGGAVAVPRVSTPSPQPAPAPRGAGVSGSRGSGSQPATVSGSRAPGRSIAPGSASVRTRSSQAVRGVAQPRPYPIDRNPPRLFNPRSGWSPWYGYGYGSYGYGLGPYYGLIGFSPWLYNSAWHWSRYGWNDPFLFDPFGYSAYAPYYGYSSRIERDDAPGVATGSLRLRINPGEARVYVNGALAGVASDFGGLTGHLELPPGVHELELRADGYTTEIRQVEVREGRTQTERISLEQP